MPDDKRLISDFEKARSLRTNWESTWQIVSDLTDPSYQFLGQKTKGTVKRGRIYDDTAPIAARNMVYAIYGLMVNPAQKWVNLVPADPELSTSEPVMRWLQAARDRMMHHFNSPSNGFNTAAMEFIYSLVYFGTGAKSALENADGTVRFRTRNLADIYAVADSDGDVVRVYRKFKLPNWEAIQKFGESSVAEDARREGKEDEEREYIQCVYWRDSFDPRRMDGRNKPIASVALDLEAKKRVHESGFDHWPFIFARFDKAPEETYGRSPVMTVLPKVGLVNAMERAQIVALEKTNDPPLIVQANSIEGPIRTAPGSIIHTRQGTNVNNMVGTLPEPNVNVAEAALDIRQASIRNGLFQDILGPLPDNDRMTATEIMERVQQRMQIVAPLVVRIQKEWLSPTIKFQFHAMQRNGELPPAPPELTESGMDIEYVGPLALAQRASDVRNFTQLMEVMGLIGAFDPNVGDNIDTDAATRGSAALLNAPLRFMRTPRDRDRRRQQRQQMEAAAQQAEVTKTMAEAAESGSKAAQQIGGGSA